jgi:acetyl-CoA C-acetyltransferase
MDMNNKLDDLVICDAVRTPFCHGNILRDFSPGEMLALVLRALVKRNGLDPDDISAVVTGYVLQDTRNKNVARIASMKAGLPEKLTDYSVHANCNSGFMGLSTVIGEIVSGEGELYIASGVESMSSFGFRLADKTGKYGSVKEIEALLKENCGTFFESFEVIDCLLEGLTDSDNNISMIEIGELMANYFGISREQQDAYTLNNLKKAVNAVENGILSNYLVPVGEIDKDAYPLNRKRMIKRPDSFSRPEPVFGGKSPELNATQFYNKHKKHLDNLNIKKIVPTVTMYTACIPGDGASGCVVTTEERAKSLGLTPFLRIINWAKAGVNPVIMGIGPLESTHKLFTSPKTKRAEGLTMEDMDLIEIHEAFAAQVLSVFKESERKYGRKWNLEKVNPYGGSLAYTHPLGATNLRLLTNIFSMFDQNPSSRYALACGCAGGGQGTSFLFERYI